MSKPTDKKEVKAVEVKVSTPATAEVVVEKKDTKVAVKKPSIFPLEQKGLEHHPQDLVDINIKKVTSLELDKLKEVELKPFFSYSPLNKQPAKTAQSSFVINGEKQVPLFEGIKLPVRNLVDSYRDLIRTAETDKIFDEIGDFDVYVYKVSLKKAYMYSNVADDVKGLVDHLNNQPIYQVLALSKGAVASITDMVRSPNPWHSSYKAVSANVGLLVVLGGDVTDVIFAGNNLVQNSKLSDSVMENSLLSNPYQITFKNLQLCKSSLIDCNISEETVSNGFTRSKTIIETALVKTTICSNHVEIKQSNIKDSRLTSEFLNIKKSKFTNLHLTGKPGIRMNGFRYNAPQTTWLSIADTIKLNSIYDIGAFEINEESSIIFIKGELGFWVNFNGCGGDEFFENRTGELNRSKLIPNKPKQEPETEHRGMNFGNSSGSYHRAITEIADAISPFVKSVLGDSTVSSSLIIYIAETIRRRIAISKNITSVINQVKTNIQGYN